jgi:uncharacterized protein (DUF1697 family)
VAQGHYVALLRGINVGGRNIVPMTDLRAAFEAAGYSDARTYIQSGNVVFTSSRAAASLEHDIEAALEERFGVPLVVVVRSRAQMRKVIDQAPAGFGDADHHCDVVFLKAPLTSAAAVKHFHPREGVEEVWAGPGVVYFSRLSARRTESRLSKIVGTPPYKSMTIRNWNTTRTLRDMLDER